MSRVRISSRVAIPSPVGGFGLVETLVVAGVSLTLGYGIVKTSLVGMQTNAIVHTSLKEQDLIHTVRTTLGDETQCKKNLKPSLPTAGTKKTVSEIKKYGSDDSITSDDVSLIKATENFKNNPLIHIQKMELEVTTSDRTFVLYYKKPQLGSLSSPGTCTATDQTGCYFIACKMNYACSDSANACPSSSTLNACSPLNCAEGGAVAGVDTARVNAIITEQLKTKNCSDNSGTTKVLKGFKETTGQLDIDCEPLPAQQQIQGCESGEVLQGFRDNGDPICVKHCSGGRKLFETLKLTDVDGRTRYRTFEVGTPYNYDTDEYFVSERTRFCQCPFGQGWKSGNCVTCEGNTRWSQKEKNCMSCTGGGAQWNSIGSGCRCPTGFKKKKVA